MEQGETELLRAIETHDSSLAMHILSSHPSEVSRKDRDDRVALHYAAECMDLETVEQIFLSDPSLIDCSDANGMTPFLMAVQAGRKDVSEFLLEKGADYSHADSQGHGAVHWATVCGQLEILNFVLDKGAQVDAVDKVKATALHYATAGEELQKDESLSILLTLIRRGAALNAKDIDGRTPLLWAASNGNIEALLTLKQAGGDIYALDRDRLSALHCAASHGNAPMLETIFSFVPRDSVEWKDRNGFTPLFYAASYGHADAARVLLSKDADPNQQDERFRTAAHCAAAKGQLRMMKLLKQFGASFETQNYRGDLPLHEAVQAGAKDVVEWLIALIPNTVSAASHNGRTPLHIAASSGRMDLVVFLCENHADVNAVLLLRGELMTPLDVAMMKKKQDVVDYLTIRRFAVKADQLKQEDLLTQRSRIEKNLQLVRRKSIEGNENAADPKTLKENEEEKRKKRETEGRGREVEEEEDSGRKGNDKREARGAVLVESRIENIIREEISRRLQKPKDDDESDTEEEENIHQSSSSKERTGKRRRVRRKKVDNSSVLESAESSEERQKGSPEDSHSNRSAQSAAKHTHLASSTKEKGTEVALMERKAAEDKRKPARSGQAMEVYEDDWEEMQPIQRTTGKDANRRYLHEKSIFQELTHLKRMQIQYGKVQEKILVHSLVSNFCKMHGLNPVNYKFTTFYSWEKFLYEQLKGIYMEERQRVILTNSTIPPQSAYNTRLNKFESRLKKARAIPLNDRIRELTRIYGNGSMTAGKIVRPKNVLSGQKRCECIGRHLLLSSNEH